MMHIYDVFLRPKKRLSQWDTAHNILNDTSIRIKAENKKQVREKVKNNMKYRLYVIEEIIEL